MLAGLRGRRPAGSRANRVTAAWCLRLMAADNSLTTLSRSLATKTKTGGAACATRFAWSVLGWPGRAGRI